jgi:four helix bundle protein
MAFLFEDLTVYRKAMIFVLGIYALNDLYKDRIIRDQLRRAAMSIPLNIAEGQGRLHVKEKRQFYNTARGSLLECIPLLQICNKLGLIDNNEYDRLYSLANEIGKMLNGLIRSVCSLDSRKRKVESRSQD